MSSLLILEGRECTASKYKTSFHFLFVARTPLRTQSARRMEFAPSAHAPGTAPPQPEPPAVSSKTIVQDEMKEDDDIEMRSSPDKQKVKNKGKGKDKAVEMEEEEEIEKEELKLDEEEEDSDFDDDPDDPVVSRIPVFLTPLVVSYSLLSGAGS